jgi:hypothetical protein
MSLIILTQYSSPIITHCSVYYLTQYSSPNITYFFSRLLYTIFITNHIENALSTSYRHRINGQKIHHTILSVHFYAKKNCYQFPIHCREITEDNFAKSYNNKENKTKSANKSVDNTRSILSGFNGNLSRCLNSCALLLFIFKYIAVLSVCHFNTKTNKQTLFVFHFHTFILFTVTLCLLFAPQGNFLAPSKAA